MPFGGQDKQASSLFYRLFIRIMLSFKLLTNLFGVCFGISGNSLHDLHLYVATEFDVGAASSHVRGDRHGIKLTSVTHDLCLALVLSGVEDVVRYAGFSEKFTQ